MLSGAAEAAVHVSAQGVQTPIVAICGPVEAAKDQDGLVRQDVEQRWCEVPMLQAESGIASIGLTESIVIAGTTWGVAEIGRGAMGLHYVRLERHARRELAGRRTGLK